MSELVESGGARLVCLPAYSPDFSPIESTHSVNVSAWRKVKASLRRVGARTSEALFEAIGEAMGTISAAEGVAFFRE